MKIIIDLKTSSSISSIRFSEFPLEDSVQQELNSAHSTAISHTNRWVVESLVLFLKETHTFPNTLPSILIV